MSSSSLNARLVKARVAFEHEQGRLPTRAYISPKDARLVLLDCDVIIRGDGRLGQWFGMDVYEDDTVRGEPVLA